MENPIERYASRVQRLAPEIRWIAANMQGWIQARGIGRDPERGAWEVRGGRMVALASRFGIERPVSFAMNLVLALILYASQFRVRQSRAAPSLLFVGIDALREPDMAKHFAESQGKQPVLIDGRGIANFFPHGRVEIFELVRELLNVRRNLRHHLSEWEALTGIPRLHAINFLMMRGHQYAYLCAWFRQHLSRPGVSQVVACAAVNSTAYAAIAAGAPAIYMPHGFLRRSIVYPNFARCGSITAIEAEHLRRRLPDCEVTVAGVPPRRLDTRRVAAVAGIFWEPDGFDRILPFMEWARRNELPVIVRPHPADTSGYWEQWRGVPGVEIVDSSASFEAFLETVRPRFLASWYSTVLFDALANGVVPVTVCPDSEELIDTVYPVRQLAISWPDQEDLAHGLIDDDRARADCLARLFAIAMGGDKLQTPQAAPAA